MILKPRRLYGVSASLSDALGSLPVTSSEWREVPPRSGIPGSRLFWAPYAELLYVAQQGKNPVALLEWQRQESESWLNWVDRGESVEPIPSTAEGVAEQRQTEKKEKQMSDALSYLQRVGKEAENIADNQILPAIKSIAYFAVGAIVLSQLASAVIGRK